MVVESKCLWSQHNWAHSTVVLFMQSGITPTPGRVWANFHKWYNRITKESSIQIVILFPCLFQFYTRQTPTGYRRCLVSYFMSIGHSPDSSLNFEASLASTNEASRMFQIVKVGGGVSFCTPRCWF